jgi:hydrogenase nickel incorporation protein HypA/HybF
VHEYSIIRALLDRVEAEARTRGATRVHRIQVRIGDLAGVDAGLLASAFEICREPSICQDAVFEVVREEARWVCRGCGREVLEGEVLQCTACGQPARLASGDGIVLERLELEVA